MKKNILILMLLTIVMVLNAQSIKKPIIDQIIPSSGKPDTTMIINLKGQNFSERSILLFSNHIKQKQIINKDSSNITVKISISKNISIKEIPIGVMNSFPFNISVFYWEIELNTDTIPIKPSTSKSLNKQLNEDGTLFVDWQVDEQKSNGEIWYPVRGYTKYPNYVDDPVIFARLLAKSRKLVKFSISNTRNSNFKSSFSFSIENISKINRVLKDCKRGVFKY